MSLFVSGLLASIMKLVRMSKITSKKMTLIDFTCLVPGMLVYLAKGVYVMEGIFSSLRSLVAPNLTSLTGHRSQVVGTSFDKNAVAHMIIALNRYF